MTGGHADAEHKHKHAATQEQSEGLGRTLTSQHGSEPLDYDDNAPPLPSEDPPLPDEAPPDDGWDPVWDATHQAYYFYNRFTQQTQWENPRVPDASSSSGAPGTHNTAAPPSTSAGAPGLDPSSPPKRVAGGYNPAIHGDYDPNADYAVAAREEEEAETLAQQVSSDPAAQYAATGAFNRFTGRYQASDLGPEKFNDENKSKRQMNAFFDFDAAANSHDGRSLKAERQNKKLSKQELKAYREKRRDKKEEKRRAWLRD